MKNDAPTQKLSTPALLRILDAAGIKSSRPYLDKKALDGCINACFEFYGHAQLFKSQKLQKKQRDEIREIRDAAIKLRDLLTANSSVTYAENYRQAFAKVSALVPDLERLVELHSLSTPKSGLESDYIDGLAYEDHFKAKSAIQWMVGVYLPEVYEIFVEPRATGKTYMAFACQVLKELRIKNGRTYYSVESIARAARGYRRSRKMAPRLDQLEWDVYRDMRFCWECGVSRKLHPSVELRKREQELEQEENPA